MREGWDLGLLAIVAIGKSGRLMKTIRRNLWRSRPHRCSQLLLLLAALLLPQGKRAEAQQPASPPGAAQPSAAPPASKPPNSEQPAYTPGAGGKVEQEVTTSDTQATFVSRVNLVPITVVVRDDNGHAVGTLKKEDFRLMDNGKPQFISRFSVESPSAPMVLDKNSADPGAPKLEGEQATLQVATRFVAYLFDDIHAQWEDLARARDAAMHQIATSLSATDRAAIFTTSGQTIQEFTNDQAKLQETLLLLRPRPIAGGAAGPNECPRVSYYMADLLINQEDREAWQTAIDETYVCANLDPRMVPASVPHSMVQTAGLRALSTGSQETRVSLDVLGKVVRRISAMPGQRSIILASPGFLAPDLHQDVSDVINRAIRANVIIGAIDARGLWTEPGFSASDVSAVGGPDVATIKNRYAHYEAQAQEDVLAELADATGGTFVHNTNDLVGGFKRLAASPEFIYVLGFTPTSLKSDGKFHNIKVSLKDVKGLTLQARKGYYAPRRQAGAAELARQDIEDALFSREVMKDFPVELHTQFFKPSETDARLTILAHMDVRRLKFRLEEGRYTDSLKVVTALFDPSGNYISGAEKVLDFHLLEETLAKKLNGGLTVKTSFDVKAGSYVVRLVARDSEGQMMAAENTAVEIP